jgi:hypothetical protein
MTAAAGPAIWLDAEMTAAAVDVAWLGVETTAAGVLCASSVPVLCLISCSASSSLSIVLA